MKTRIASFCVFISREIQTPPVVYPITLLSNDKSLECSPSLARKKYTHDNNKPYVMCHVVIIYIYIFIFCFVLYPVSTFSNCQYKHLCLCVYTFLISQTSGYLNLLANCIDNFTHGLAVAGSFLVSKKVRSCGEVLLFYVNLNI